MSGVGTDIGGYQLENKQVDHGILSLPVISVSTNNEVKLEKRYGMQRLSVCAPSQKLLQAVLKNRNVQ